MLLYNHVSEFLLKLVKGFLFHHAHTKESLLICSNCQLVNFFYADGNHGHFQNAQSSCHLAHQTNEVVTSACASSQQQHS